MIVILFNNESVNAPLLIVPTYQCEQGFHCLHNITDYNSTVYTGEFTVYI